MAKRNKNGKSGTKLSASKMAEVKGGATQIKTLRDLVAGPNDATVVDRPSLGDLVSIRTQLIRPLIR